MQTTPPAPPADFNGPRIFRVSRGTRKKTKQKAQHAKRIKRKSSLLTLLSGKWNRQNETKPPSGLHFHQCTVRSGPINGDNPTLDAHHYPDGTLVVVVGGAGGGRHRICRLKRERPLLFRVSQNVTWNGFDASTRFLVVWRFHARSPKYWNQFINRSQNH